MISKIKPLTFYNSHYSIYVTDHKMGSHITLIFELLKGHDEQ